MHKFILIEKAPSSVNVPLDVVLRRGLITTRRACSTCLEIVRFLRFLRLLRALRPFFAVVVFVAGRKA